jgi:hypothetical protein
MENRSIRLFLFRRCTLLSCEDRVRCLRRKRTFFKTGFRPLKMPLSCGLPPLVSGHIETLIAQRYARPCLSSNPEVATSGM